MEALAQPLAPVQIQRREDQGKPRLAKAGDQQKSGHGRQEGHDQGGQKIVNVKASRDHGAQPRQKSAYPCRYHPQKRMLGKEGNGGRVRTRMGGLVRTVGVGAVGRRGTLPRVVIRFGVPRLLGSAPQPQVGLEGFPAQKQIGSSPTGAAVGQGRRIHEEADHQPQNDAKKVYTHPGPAGQGHGEGGGGQKQPCQYVPGVGGGRRQKPQTQGGRPQKQRTGSQQECRPQENPAAEKFSQYAGPFLLDGGARARRMTVGRHTAGMCVETIFHGRPPANDGIFPLCWQGDEWFPLLYTEALVQSVATRRPETKNPFHRLVLGQTR